GAAARDGGPATAGLTVTRPLAAAGLTIAMAGRIARTLEARPGLRLFTAAPEHMPARRDSTTPTTRER
ncbi:MAG: hypothetical protein ABSF25_20710, partial [Bryobacteraceae bacterium]